MCTTRLRNNLHRIGSSQKDDDMPGSYGGVVYKYNKHIVELSFPYRNNGPRVSRGLVFTGKCYNSRTTYFRVMFISLI
jgi:hypothetical protein